MTIVNYVNNRTKVIIICAKHGSFLQTPDNHLQGMGCKKCSISSQTSSKEIFVNQAIEYFGGEEGLEKRKQNDEIKNSYCEKNNIKLIRIRFNENIEERLNQILHIQ